MAIYVDHTHLGRHVTGLERITLELFSPTALAPLPITPVTANGTARMIATQTFGLPARLAASSSLLLCPGFPPTPLLRPFAARVLPYIHDIFLLSRRTDLNPRARIYMAPPFVLALRTYPRFLVNSLDTKSKVSQYCRPNSEIVPYRPSVRNVFNLETHGQKTGSGETSSLRLVALGTVEPRKNFAAAANILDALRARGYPDAHLDIIGRAGWGDDWSKLANRRGVILHGYQSADRVKEILERADILVCTSHEEGLGLPLLEAQYAGLPVVAPDAPIFHEVLGQSGIFVDVNNPIAAAEQIVGAASSPTWRAGYAALGIRNLDRWNGLASADRSVVIDLIMRLIHDSSRAQAEANHNRPIDTRSTP
ncbi:MAG: glycosyltransferase [Xanthobacteraceae bacterium]